MMRLCDALASLDRFGSDTTISAAEPWAAAWREGRVPTVDERCEAVIHDAVFDSYLEAS